MPLYDIICEASGAKSERIIKLSDFDAPIFCACGSRARRAISAPMFSVDKTGYTCPVTGKWIGSKRAHEENLKHQGCRVLEEGETSAAAKFREAEEAKFDRKIEDTVEREIESWDSAKKEQLHNELINQRLDVVVERK